MKVGQVHRAHLPAIIRVASRVAVLCVRKSARLRAIFKSDPHSNILMFGDSEWRRDRTDLEVWWEWKQKVIALCKTDPARKLVILEVFGGLLRAYPPAAAWLWKERADYQVRRTKRALNHGTLRR
jgi:hypothetical protein